MAAGPLIGIRMERRQHFLGLRVRTELMKLYRTTVPGQVVREKRQRTAAKVASSIQSHFGSEYRVEVFGSTQYGVDGQTSDLDLVVIDPNRMTGFTPDVDLDSLPQIYKISEVSRVLQHCGFKILQKIPTAIVPIVKFKDLSTDIQCDLNINNQLGSINTSLIRDYCDILPVLRPLLLAIKRWARPLGYNSPAGAPGMPITFSSYTLTIMTIGLLQVSCSCLACHMFQSVANSLRQGSVAKFARRYRTSRRQDVLAADENARKDPLCCPVEESTGLDAS
ncbi:hypothetical protein BJV74DRAFT_406271 [Russula compacta]|nr:hypothetical protein BJV74DRAFT_406271 [Russula compacta]